MRANRCSNTPGGGPTNPHLQRVAREGNFWFVGFKVFRFRGLFEGSSPCDAVPRDAENGVIAWFLVVLVVVLGLLLIRMR